MGSTIQSRYPQKYTLIADDDFYSVISYLHIHIATTNRSYLYVCDIIYKLQDKQSNSMDMRFFVVDQVESCAGGFEQHYLDIKQSFLKFQN